jgi:hypothetical protein
MLTHGAMRGCGLTSLVVCINDKFCDMRGCGLTSLVVCINDKFCDIRERNVTIRSEI